VRLKKEEFMKRLLSLALIVSALALVVVGCSQAPKELKVAVLAPLSGPVPTFGVSTRDGALLAIKEWNAKGGVLNMKITAIVEDSQCTPDPAVNAANKVINQDKVKYIIGEVCSKASIPVSDIANANKVIQVSPTSTNPSLTIDKDGNAKPYIFRACFSDALQGLIGANFVYQKLGARKAFLMVDQANDYVKGLSSVFEESFTKAGGTIAGTASYTADDKDFSAILAKIKSSKADVVYLPDYYNIVNLVTKQAKEKGIKVPFVGGDGWDSSDLDVKAADGGYYTNHYAPEDPRAEVQDFIKAYGAEYKDASGNPIVPDALAVLAYDAMNMTLTAITNAKSADTDKVRVALENITFNAVSGQITLDKQHNPVKPLTILAVKGGKIQFDSVVNP
jgi:branched-chain amino acid transport system substrate-binding protein